MFDNWGRFLNLFGTPDELGRGRSTRRIVLRVTSWVTGDRKRDFRVERRGIGCGWEGWVDYIICIMLICTINYNANREEKL